MFESAELHRTVDKGSYAQRVPTLRADLLDAQYDVGALKRFPVIILINGVNGAGKGETVNQMNAWMDPRYILTQSFAAPSDEERERPVMWRFWRTLPPKGQIGILFGNWYTEPIIDRAFRMSRAAKLDRAIVEIQRFEQTLADEGALILKFWLHLSKEDQRRRLKTLSSNKETRWRVTKADWDRFKMRDELLAVSENVLRHTSTAHAPWYVINGADARYRSLTVGNIVLESMRKRLAVEKEHDWRARNAAAPLVSTIDRRDVLNSLDMSLAIPRRRFERELEKTQGRLNRLTRDRRFRGRSLIAAFEGSDAAGKGGAIRRITTALDARQYHIIPVAAPTEEERAQPYLWRFWRHLPRAGRVAIFDRSWYGRVLVERVEGFCQQADWMRAYSEINDFEDQLVRDGAVVVKFWLAITPEEQLKRFKEREKTRFKRFKITDEDWRNRKKWDEYEHAVCDMVDRTSTAIARWTLVEANDKFHARIKVLKTLCERLEEAFG